MHRPHAAVPHFRLAGRLVSLILGALETDNLRQLRGWIRCDRLCCPEGPGRTPWGWPALGRGRLLGEAVQHLEAGQGAPTHLGWLGSGPCQVQLAPRPRAGGYRALAVTAETLGALGVTAL